MTSSSGKSALIYGGCGALGSSLVRKFKAEGWHTCSIDMKSSVEADMSIVLSGGDLNSADSQKEYVLKSLEEGEEKKEFNIVVNVAGGWAGGNSGSPDFVKNCDLMWKQSVWSACVSAAVASKYLVSEGGCLVLTGASAATGPTPSMIGYGMAKAAIHHLVQSLSSPDSGLPENSKVYAILPITLDTPMNRKWMGNTSDTTKWTSLDFVSDLLFGWASDVEKRPKTNGSLVQLHTENNETTLVFK